MPPTPALACLDCRERLTHRRGLCMRCYGRLSASVRAGETTWQELEKGGRSRPPRRSRWGRQYPR